MLFLFGLKNINNKLQNFKSLNTDYFIIVKFFVTTKVTTSVKMMAIVKTQGLEGYDYQKISVPEPVDDEVQIKISKVNQV